MMWKHKRIVNKSRSPWYHDDKKMTNEVLCSLHFVSSPNEFSWHLIFLWYFIDHNVMFRKYMFDLSTYLSSEAGITISNEVIAHILWDDDLILFSDTPSGLQKQLKGLLKFCSNNKIIVNEIKTKSMCFGTNENLNVFFNGKPIQQVTQYKYLGVIVRSVNKVGQDVSSNNYRYSLAELFSAWSGSYNSYAPYRLVYFSTCSILWYDQFLRVEVM